MALEALLDEEPLDFTLKDLSGVSHTLSDYKGKLVFISFFATWCPPCREEMPLFDALVKENDDVIVLAVQAATTEMRKAQVSAAEADKAAALARDYLTESKLDLMVLLDPDGKIANSEYYITQGIPGNFIVDKEGVLRYFQEGGYTKEHLDLVMTYMRALEKTE